MSFPEVWKEILMSHELVVGSPVQQIENGEPVLEVRLRSGERLICSRDGYRLA